MELFRRNVDAQEFSTRIEREKKKQNNSRPLDEKAMARKSSMPPMRDDDIPVTVALVAAKVCRGRQPAPTGRSRTQICGATPRR